MPDEIQDSPIPSDAPDFPAPGWSRYEPKAYLGEGFHGFVFKAWDATLNRFVALKFLHRIDPTRMTRLLDEARAQAKVDHPRIAKVFEVGEVQGHPYIAMQFVDGPSLDEVAKGLPLKTLLSLVAEVAEGVQAAHSQGLVHRDLKANNILLERREDDRWDPVVVDFGHAADEAGGERPDRRHDVWALGEMLYTRLGGFPSASGPSSIAMTPEDQRRPRVPLRQLQPGLPVEVEAIVMKALAPDAEATYPSAQAFGEDLRRFVRGELVSAYAGGGVYQTRKWIGRHRLLVAGMVMLLVAGTSVGIVQWRVRSQAFWGLRYSQSVDEWVGIYRAAQMLPDHPLAETRQRLEQQLTTLDTSIQQQGSLARGPGEVALGRGYLALQEIDKAIFHFHRAEGLHAISPEAKWAYGLALSQAYEREREALENALPDEKQRLGKLTDLHRTLRDPALALLRNGQGGGRIHPGLIEAHIAYCEDRVPEAILALQRALKDSPWLVEAKLLECQIRLRTFSSASTGLGEEEIRPLLETARQAHQEGHALARSEPGFLLGEAKLLTLYRERLSNFAQYPQAVAEARNEALDKVLKADPKDLAALSAKARAALDHALELVGAGKDPLLSFNEAIDMAADISRQNPSDAENWVTLIQARLRFSEFLSRTQKDATPQIQAIARDREQLLKVNHKEGVIQGGALAFGMYLQSHFESNHGKDVRPLLDKALTFAREAAAVEGGHPAIQGWYASVLGARGDAEARHHGDPRRWISESAGVWQRMLERQPKMLPAAFNGAVQDGLIASWEISQGKDPRAAFDGAYDLLEKADAISPGHPQVMQFLGQTAALQAIWEVNQGRDGKALFAKAEAALAKVTDPELIREQQIFVADLRAEAALLGGEDPSTFVNHMDALTAYAKTPQATASLGRVHVLLALYRFQHGQDPSAELERAEAILNETLRQNPGEIGALSGRLFGQFLRGDLAKRNGQPFGAPMKLAQDSVDVLKKQDPRSVTLPLWNAALSLAQARLEGGNNALARADLEQLASKPGSTRAWARWTLQVLGTRLGVGR